MANENLKRALTEAGMPPGQFADIVGVDPKTVERWITGRTPRPRHRHDVARALELSQQQLWPETVARSSGNGSPPVTGTPSAGLEPVGEVVGAWGRFTDPGVPDLGQLVAAARQRIDVCHEGRLFALPAAVIDAIRDRAEAGCQVQILTYWPTRELAALVGVRGIELWLSNPSKDTCLIRCDDDMLVLLAFAVDGGSPPAAIHVRHQTDGGLFDRYLEHLDLERAGPNAIPITDAEQFADYLDDADDEDDGDVGDDQEPDDSDGHALARQPPDQAAGRDGPRRWPRRSG